LSLGNVLPELFGIGPGICGGVPRVAKLNAVGLTTLINPAPTAKVKISKIIRRFFRIILMSS
jgi:hypothetical protein